MAYACPWLSMVYGIDGHPIIGNIGIESPTEIPDVPSGYLT